MKQFVLIHYTIFLTLGLSLLHFACSVKDLYMIGLYPFHGPWNGGRAMLTGSQIALKQVNERSDVLPGYRLNLLWNDTECDPGLGLDVMFKHFYTSPTKIMIIGALCSTVSQATAQVSYRWNVVQLLESGSPPAGGAGRTTLSCIEPALVTHSSLEILHLSISPGTSSPALSNKKRFKMYLRTNGPETDLNPAKIELFKTFGWFSIATIHQTYELFSVANDHLITLMKTSNMKLVTSEIISIDPSVQILKLKEHGARIIAASFYEDMAVKFFCEVYKAGLYGPKIVWLLLGWYNEKWWKTKIPSVDCSPEQIEEAIEGYFSVDQVELNPKDEVTVSGHTPRQLYEIYRNWTNYEEIPGLEQGLKGYDAVWAAALALNKTANDLEETGSERLEDFSYENDEMGQLLFNNAMNVSFVGIRGRVSFNKYGDLNSAYKISRFQNGIKQMVGLYYSNKIEWSTDTTVVWKGGVIPKDSVTLIHISKGLSQSLYITICCVSGLGFLLTCVFLAFNIGYRKSRTVKMSSPNLNNVTLVGCLVLYGTVLWESNNMSTFVLFCQMKLVSLTFGFSLAFGGLFAKTWRVYVIFTHGTNQKKVVKDKQLIMMVCGLITVNISIIVTWFIVDPFQTVIRYLPAEIIVDKDIEIHESIKSCESSKQIYFLGSLLTLQGIILLFGVFLALQTRKVKVDGLNDSKMIGVCIYNIVVLSFLGVMVSLTVKFDIDLNYGITSCIIILATTVTQCLIVVPKIIGHFSVSRVDDIDQSRRNVMNVSTIQC